MAQEGDFQDLELDEEVSPLVNCHTHIFTREHVPPFLARSFVFWPFYYLINLQIITSLIKSYLKVVASQKYRPDSLYNILSRLLQKLNNRRVTKILLGLIAAWLSVNALVICLVWLSKLSPLDSDLQGKIDLIIAVLTKFLFLLSKPSMAVGISIVLIVFVLIPNSRKLILTLLKWLWKFIGFIPGKQSMHLLQRYLLLGRFALYGRQARVFSALKNQYPPGSRFVVLPMDMKYMAAGPIPIKGRYRAQMAELIKIKKGPSGRFLEPFVFIDPRRIRERPNFFDYSVNNHQVSLKKSEVKDYIERHQFSGFKIYPALGYYPFDEDLLPLWKYAADNKIPIMTHVIRGTIFYRGRKLTQWNQHPIFKESDGKGNVCPLALLQKKNVDFSVNFTHPMNYLCLLEEPLLRLVVGQAKNPVVKELFGYEDETTPLQQDLSHLKICMAHFGGEEEWVKYLESDRYAFAQRLIRDRGWGINFQLDHATSLNWNLLSQVWKFVDWYSIITSMIVQHQNVYADISYILSKPRILPLLKETLNPEVNPHLSQRVLFGTDFYVVRNHFSEKDLLAQMRGGLSKEEFNRIARINPNHYLQ